MKIFYSADDNSFYPEELKENYVLSGSWPESALEVAYSVYKEFALDYPPANKMRTSSPDGYPMWVDIPPLSHEEEVALADSIKLELMRAVSKLIDPLQDAVDLEIATQEEVELIGKLKKYRVLVNRVDTQNAPNIEWPENPA
jgi:hypothetical protein